MEGSKWDEVLDKLIDTFKYELPKIDRKQIVKFCVENQTTRNAAEDFLKRCKWSREKSSEIAEKKKEEGNKKFNEEKYNQSLTLYTESIFHANKNDKCLPLAYANRALTLQKMGFLSECVQDIDMALDAGYPKCKSQKLIFRKAKALAELGEINSDKISMEVLKLCEEKGCTEQIEKEVEKLKICENGKSSNSNLPKPAGGENENFASASNYLSVNYDESKGRHVVATHDIEMGDVLFVEKPFAFIFFEEGCQNCLKETKAPIPCHYCFNVSYCSRKCREEFWKLAHSFECGFSRLFKSIGIAHLSLRTVLSASSSLDELRKALKSIPELQYENGTVPYKNNGYENVYNLVHNYEYYKADDLFQYAMTSVLLALHLKNHTDYCGTNLSDDDLEFLASIILRHILQLICNGHAITDFKESPGSVIIEMEEVRCGTAIYSSVSMMNHSCIPSIINSFQGKWLVVRAVKPIKKGEEVFNCYGPHAARMERASRQELLSKQYFFICKCPFCTSDYDLQDIYTAFKCPDCKGPFIQKDTENPMKAVCHKCGLVGQITKEILKKQIQFYGWVKEGERNYSSDIHFLGRCLWEGWKLGTEIFYEFHKDLCHVAEQNARCSFSMKKIRRCIEYLRHCLRSIEERFGSFSIELAHEMVKLGNVITYGLCIDEGILSYRRAHSIFTLLFGPQYKALQEIERNIEFLNTLK